MPLQKADQTKTMRFTDGAAWLILRTQINKGEADTINDLNSRTRISSDVLSGAGAEAVVEMVPNSAEVNRTLFDILAVDWSVSDEKPTARDYDELDKESAEWVDDCIRQAVAARHGGSAEGNSSRSSSNGASRKRSSKKPAASPTTSAAAEE